MKKLKYILLMVVLILTSAAFDSAAASAANIGAQFLQLSPSPRASALADSYVSETGAADTVYYNPAAGAYLPNLSFSGSYIRWIGSMNYFSFFATTPLTPIMTLGAGLTGLSVGSIPETMDPGNGDITLTGNNFTAGDFCGLLNYSVRLHPSFSAGANFKFISQSLTSVKSYAFGSDIGLFFNQALTGIRAGFVVQNLGTAAKFVSESAALPLSMKLGGSYTLNFIRNNMAVKNILFTAQVRRTSGESISASAGVEGTFWNVLMLRGGYEYQPNNDSSGLKTGIGLNYDKIKFNNTGMGLQINYSLNFFKTLGMAHSFEVNTTFQSVKEPIMDRELLRKADASLTNAAYEEAMTNYKMFLSKTPKYARAAYNTACIYSIDNDVENAFFWLERVAKTDNSAVMRKRIETDPDLANVRKAPKYQELIKKFKK